MGRASFRHPRYGIVRLLGEGGMGRVYLAHDLLEMDPEGAPREVALKVYPARARDERLKKEFLALRALHHPGIARAYHFGTAADGAPFFTMEHVKGAAIDEHAARRGSAENGPARLEACVRLFIAAAAAAAYMHRRGVLHLDIKPANILVVEPGEGLEPRPVLIDFGLVRAAGAAAGPVSHATLPFAPPEVLAGGAPGPASDVYSLGATFHRTLSGRNPYSGSTAALIARAQASSAPAPLPGCPQALSRVIVRALARDPAHRFRNAGELHRALLRAAASLPGAAEEEPAILFHEPDFAGRAREVEAVDRWLDGDRREAPLLEVEGDEGMGKTRFLERVEMMIETRGRAVIRPRLARGEASFLTDCARALDVLAPARTPARREMARALDAFRKASLRERDEGTTRPGPTDEEARVLAGRLLHVLAPLLEEGAFLLVDEFHLASPAERGLVLESARALMRCERAPAGGIVTAALPGLPRPGGSPPAARVRLGPFRLEEALEIDLEGLDGALARFTPERARKLKTEIHRQTEGHPLFYVRGLLDLAGDAEALVRLAPTERIAARIARLDPMERDAAGVLAALERPMALTEIADALALGKRAGAVIERLRAGGIVAQGRGGARIIHDSVGRAVLEALGDGGRRAAHALLAGHLSRKQGGAALAEAAWHAFAGGDRDLGSRLAERASLLRTLLPSPAPERVISALRQAAALSGSGASEALLEKASDALEALGRYEECLALRAELVEARERKPRRGDASALLRLQRKLGAVSHRAGRIDLARRHLELALSGGGAAAAPLECLRARAELALLHHFRGETDLALEHSRKGLDLWRSKAAAPRKDAIQSAIDLHGILGQVSIRKLQLEEAISVLREGLRLAQETGSRANIALILNNLALANHLAGRFGLALGTFRRAEALARDLGDEAALVSIRLNIAQILAKQGQFAQAGELLDEIEEVPALAQSKRLGLYALYTRGLILGLLRAGADEVWSRVEIQAGEVGDAFLVRIARIYRGEEQIIRGALSEARRHLVPFPGEDEAEEPVTAGMRAARKAFIEAALGHEKAAELARAAALAFRPAAPTVIAAWNDFHAGASLLESGRIQDAERVLETARKAFRSTGFAAGEIECSLALADLRLRARPTAAAALRAASRSIEAARSIAASAPPPFSPRSREPRAALLEVRLRLARRRATGGKEGAGDIEGLVSKAAADLGHDADARVAVELVAAAAAKLAGDSGRAAESLRRLEEARAETARGLDPEDARAYLARDPWERFGLEEWRPLAGGRALDEKKGRALAAMLASLAASPDPLLRDGGPSEVLRSILASIADESGAERAEIVVQGQAVAAWGSRRGAPPGDASTIEAPLLRGGLREGIIRLESFRGQTFRAEDEAFLEAAAHAIAPHIPGAHGASSRPARTREAEAPGTEALEPTRPLGTGDIAALSASRRPPSTEALARLLEPQGIVAAGREMRRVLRALRSLARSEVPVLITGESGTGKNVAARILHLLGPRGDGPFVSQNAAAVPSDLFEADLFGYEQGAFTGAEHARTGFLFQAGGGTFHIEEVGDLGLELQRRLLRVIEEKVVRPLGSARTRTLDVRFVASTQRDLEAMVRRGEFRKDLFFRIDGARVHLPPLRQRLDEIPELVRHYWRELAGPEERFPRAAMDALLAHDWPGNIRELISVLRRVRIETSGTPRAQDIRAAIGVRDGMRLFSPALFQSRRYGDVLRSLEECYLEHLVEVHGGDLARIAAELGTTTRSIYRKFEKLGLRPKDLKK